ncbi:MAG TPA: LuxR family transcriptional regulator [Nevskiaceae bacterium]|nr:LuxR family transcriptional regulator [Nevskiaceae bacterium]
MSSAQHLERHLSKHDLVGILDVIDAAISVGSEAQFRHLMQLTAQIVPIERAHVSVADLDGTRAVVRTSRQLNLNFPDGWLSTYRQEHLHAIDPVARVLFTANRPLIWSQVRERDRSRAARAFYGQAAEFGLRNGFSFGAPFAKSPSASFFSCAGADLTHTPRHVLALQYLVPHLHAALSKMHLGMLKEAPGLTPREIEVLNWAKFGKTNWEISLQLNTSQRVVKFHIENAIRKLHANNRSQAVAIALSQGLIEWG